MLLAADVHYKTDYAKTALVLFEDWTNTTASQIIEVTTAEVLDYDLGLFYKKELPCILEALQKVDLTGIDPVTIDRNVFIDANNSLGLEVHLYADLKAKIPVVGSAKTKFQNDNKTVLEVLVGESKNPLFVSCIGIGLKWIAQQTKELFGPPYLLQLMNQKTKEA